jgi:hypothetical protein
MTKRFDWAGVWDTTMYSNQDISAPCYLKFHGPIKHAIKNISMGTKLCLSRREGRWF